MLPALQRHNYWWIMIDLVLKSHRYPVALNSEILIGIPERCVYFDRASGAESSLKMFQLVYQISAPGHIQAKLNSQT